ncbi:MAG TPA: hypothetical protein VJI68_02275 [Candidatus Nanoarchaeia archaeon]|nr:hypothetical protein [Candidatus Nanoarchaeia archaeon]
MVLAYDLTLEKALDEIGFVAGKSYSVDYDVFFNNARKLPGDKNKSIDSFSQSKSEQLLFDLDRFFNYRFFNTIPYSTDPLFLYTMLSGNKKREIPLFMSETIFNAIDHGEYTSVHHLELRLTTKGTVIGVCQLGNGFNAVNIDARRIFKNLGGGFTAYRKISSSVFFDDPLNARGVYLKYVF